MAKVYFIYKTTNLVNGKFYIGKKISDENLSLTYLGSGVLINKAIAKYGVENFKREILEFCDSAEHLSERETFWIKETHARELGYNLTDGGDGLINPSQETRDKMSKARRGKKIVLSEEGRRRKIEANIRTHKGKHLTEEQKKRLSEVNKGNWAGDKNPMKNPETAQNVSAILKDKYSHQPNSMTGRHHSEETRRKISEAQKGERGNMYGKPAHNKGVSMSEEQKAKLREAKAKLTPEQKHEIAMAAVRARKSQVCPVCGRQIIGSANYTRHFNAHK